MFLKVADASDPAMAGYRDVADPAALARKRLFVVEGRLPVGRLIDDRRFEIESIAATPSATHALAPLLARHSDLSVYICEPSILEAVTGFDFHRGCLALARRPAAALPVSTFARASRLIALEAVGNPDNVGGLFRAALALGAAGVLLDRASADPLYRKAIRTSMGASLRVPFTRVEPWPYGLDELKSGGFQVIALTVVGEKALSDTADEGLNAVKASGASLSVVHLTGVELGKVLGDGPKQSGGMIERVNGNVVLGSVLAKIADNLLHQYVLTYNIPDGVKLNERLSLSTSRKGVTLLAPSRLPDK